MVALLGSLFIGAMPPQDECMSQLRDILHTMSSRESMGICSLDYQVRSKPRQYNTPETILRVKMRASKNQMEVVSSQIEAYQDKENAFTLVPSRKIIYWGDSQLNKKDTADRNDFLKLQSLALDHSKIKSCKELRSGNYDKEIILSPDAGLRKKFGFKEITFLINTKTNSVYRTLLSYTAGQFEYVEVTYLSLNYREKTGGLNYSVKSKFLTPQDKLLAKYSGYELIDVRAKRK